MRSLKTDNIKRGMTLIELLIVIAILSIMVVATGNIIFYSHHEHAILRHELALQQSINLTLQSLALDAAVALEARINSEN